MRNASLEKARDIAITALEDCAIKCAAVTKARETNVYLTQPNVDSAISQDVSFIVFTLLYIKVCNVSV